MNEPEEDFATMFERRSRRSASRRARPSRASIVAIGEEIGARRCRRQERSRHRRRELKDDEGNLEVAVGDRIQATVVSTPGGLKLSRRFALARPRRAARGCVPRRPVRSKARSSGPVKGGYEVSIARQRAFCPFSQIDIMRNTDPAQHDGRVYQFRIIEYKEGGKNLVVSRRALLENSRRQPPPTPEVDRRGRGGDRARRLGARVRRVRRSGRRRAGTAARLGNGMGARGGPLAGRQARRRDHRQGAALDDDKQKISLGLKQLLDDPWSRAGDATGRPGATRPRDSRRGFGPFVELEPGVDGLVPLSESGVARDGDIKKAFPVGTDIQVVVLEVDAAAKRIRLSVTAVEKMREGDEVREYTERADVAPAQGFGSLADKLRGALRRGE